MQQLGSVGVTYVFAFDHKHRKPPMSLKDLLGGKGANLAEMTSVLQLPVPPGFTISTDACRESLAASAKRNSTSRQVKCARNVFSKSAADVPPPDARTVKV